MDCKSSRNVRFILSVAVILSIFGVAQYVGYLLPTQYSSTRTSILPTFKYAPDGDEISVSHPQNEIDQSLGDPGLGMYSNLTTTSSDKGNKIEIPQFKATSKDAYVFFYPESDRRRYFDNALTMIFALKHDDDFRDPLGRDIVILVSDETSRDDIETFSKLGCLLWKMPDLTDGFPKISSDTERYRLTWDKLYAWTLIDYERILLMDLDLLFNRPFQNIWDDPNSQLERGEIAAMADPWFKEKVIPQEDGNYFNSGLLMIAPDMQTYENLLKVDVKDTSVGDQNLLNQYYTREREAEHPWKPLNHWFMSVHPNWEDRDAGVRILHHSEYDGHVPELEEMWRDWTNKRKGWEMAMQQVKKSHQQSESRWGWSLSW